MRSLIVLIRADSTEHLDWRQRELFNYWGIDDREAGPAARVQVLRGDISAPSLGIERDAFDALAKKVTHIIHAAGNVRLNQTWSAAKRSAVDAARSILDFSKACQQNGQFRKLEMISTVGVAGATPGLIRERLYDNPRHFRNTYEAAKAEAETLVWAALCEGLPGTIHRPSMIVGDSRTGRIRQFQVFYHLSEFLTGRKTWGVVPETNDAKLDIVSVDYVAQAIYLAHKCSSTEGKILHLCSGPEKSWTLSDLTARLRALMSDHGRSIPRLRRVPLSQARRLYGLLGTLWPTKKRRFFKSLPFFLDYLSIEQEFDNSDADAFLSRHGLDVSTVESYLSIIMSAYWNGSPTRAKAIE